MNESENTTTQNLWDAVKAVLSGRFIAIPVCLKKQEKNKIHNLKKLSKEEMKSPRINRRKDIIRITAEINEKETKEDIVKINKVKAGSSRR